MANYKRLFENLQNIVLELEDINGHAENALILAAMAENMDDIAEALKIIHYAAIHREVTHNQFDRVANIQERNRKRLRKIGCDPWQ